MHREVHSWWSPSLHKHMEIAVYGHWGFALLMFPTAMADYLEYERFSLIGSIAHFIDAGKCKVFSINSINSESWMNNSMHPADRAWRHQQYNEYIVNEVVPFIWDHCRGRVMIITSGASLGAWHAANALFRRPDLFDGVIAMSGTFDVKIYTDGYYDDNCYFNSPVDYLPNLNDDYYLSLLRRKHHIHLVSGQGAYEGPQHSRRLSEILTAKGIPHELDLWGHDIPHEWWVWHKMLPHYLGTRF